MKRIGVATALSVACIATALSAQQPSTDSPYKVLQRAKVGGEGGSDYIYADVVGRRLYIPRGGTVPCRDGQRAGQAGDPGSHHRIRPRDARAGRRDSRHGRQRRCGRSEVGSRLLEQQAGLDVRHEDAEADQDDRRRLGAAGRDPTSTRSTTASTSSAIRRRTRRSSTRRTAPSSAGSISAACRSRAWPTARERCTSSCRTRRAA